ncbi:MAG: hypothetical protein D8M59_08380 [Planctomycetes bacterium]|nr:hypothetical protein [Planctomycetota bacterium]NOG53989.1 hypothetical protein [Planctomycetota bacterium]
MHSPLVMLTWLRFRGWGRRLIQSARTGRGLLFLIIGIVMIGLWVVSVANPYAHRSEPDTTTVLHYAPFFMLGITLMFCLGSGRKSICFSAPEIDFLFPGPFSRRRLLVYKMSMSLVHSAMLGVVLTIWQGRFGASYPVAYLAFLLLLTFSNVLSIAISLAWEAAGDPTTGKPIRIGFALLGLAAIGGAITVLVPILQNNALLSLDALVYVRDSVFGRILLIPFDAMALVLTGQRLIEDVLLWTGVVVVMIGLAGLLALRLDRYFVEASLAASIRLEAKMARAKSGHALAVSASGPASLTLPMLPRWNGAGVIAWRQMINALRCFKGLLIFMCILAVSCGPALYMTSRVGGDETDSRAVGFIFGIGGMWLVFFIPMMLKFDFRSDIEQMDFLKSLPISPFAVVCGQVIAPTIVLIGLIVVLVGIVSLAVPEVQPYYWMILPFLLPGATLLFAAENLVFLLAPIRPHAASTDSVNMMGRGMVMVFAKVGILLGAAIPAACVGAIGAFTGQGLGLARWQWAAMSGAAVWIVLCIATYVVLRYAAQLYDRYDPAVHEPA